MMCIIRTINSIKCKNPLCRYKFIVMTGDNRSEISMITCPKCGYTWINRNKK